MRHLYFLCSNEYTWFWTKRSWFGQFVLQKNEFENYDNAYQSFSKMIDLFSDLDEWISQSKYCITDNAIHQECSRFSKKLCCRLQNVLFYFMMLLKRIIITFKIRNSHAKQQYCSHSRHKNVPFMSSKCDHCYFWPFITFNINQN